MSSAFVRQRQMTASPMPESRQSCSVAGHGAGRFDMDDHIDNLRVAGHQPIFDDMGCGVRLAQRGVAVEPDVKIEEDVIGRASSTDSVTPDYLRYGPYDVAHVV